MVRTLRNAIEQDKRPPRVPVRRLARDRQDLDGEDPRRVAELRGEGATDGLSPCGTCESCRAIAEATSLDVIEMDAASNNSVDDIRDLRERVAFAPVSGRHKVYILDEAHMLSTAAWNAFLKTLEEPPPHTIFVLATTEANKVLPTVVDRCHRFDFSRPTRRQIAEVLRRVAEAESIELPDEASALIARRATGSFRDALGDAGAVVAYSGPAIELDDVLAVLGAADADLLFGAVDASPRRRAPRCSPPPGWPIGRDVGRFFGDLEAHARALLVRADARRGAAGARGHRGAGPAAGRAGRAASGRAEVVRLLDLVAAALRAMKDGAEAAHAARARPGQGRPARARPVGEGADGAARAARRGAPAPARPPPRPRAREPATAAGRAAPRQATPAARERTGGVATPPRRGRRPTRAQRPHDGAAGGAAAAAMASRPSTAAVGEPRSRSATRRRRRPPRAGAALASASRGRRCSRSCARSTPMLAARCSRNARPPALRRRELTLAGPSRRRSSSARRRSRRTAT